MPVYQGLDIVTNKVTAEEQALCRHHMISFVDPLVSKGKLPIIVGGTNYYIESLLWKVLVDTQESAESAEVGEDIAALRKAELEKLGGAELHKRLTEVDPKMAAMLHPNNARKIARSLQVHEMTGVTHSRLLEEQQGQEGADRLGGPLRYPAPCVFWLHADVQALDPRLDARVDAMLSAGLLEELRDFHVRYNRHRVQENRKLMHWWQGAQDAAHTLRILLTPHPHTPPPPSFKRYISSAHDPPPAPSRITPPECYGSSAPAVYGLDVSDVSRWEETVLQPALQILHSLRKGESPAAQPMRVDAAHANKRSRHTCELCDKVIIGDLEWTAHLKSKKHHFHVRKRRRLEDCPDEGPAPGVDGGAQTTPGSPSHQGPGSGSSQSGQASSSALFNSTVAELFWVAKVTL
ncbi:hypothetical protein CRUP_033768 [Coryphaenoides rupestris]|nr:hypothetical protein CRUP_033768 [Coryphaenoides rupestris]